MPSILKRGNIHSEIFESEKNYAADLTLWCKNFRRLLLVTEKLRYERRMQLNESIFANIESILDMHLSILRELAYENERCRWHYVKKICDVNNLDIKEVIEDRNERFKFKKKDSIANISNARGSCLVQPSNFKSLFKSDNDYKNCDFNLMKRIEQILHLSEKNTNNDHKKNNQENNNGKHQFEKTTSNNNDHIEKIESIKGNYEQIGKNKQATNIEEHQQTSNCQKDKINNEIANRLSNINLNSKNNGTSEESKAKVLKDDQNKPQNATKDVVNNEDNTNANQQATKNTNNSSKKDHTKSDERHDSKTNENFQDQKNNEEEHNSPYFKPEGFVFPFFRNDIYQVLLIHNTDAAEVYDNVNYTDIFERYLELFGIYKYYTKLVPKIIYTIEQECKNNIDFQEMVNLFLLEFDQKLGIQNFVFRPSQKITRYALLFSTVLKTAKNDAEKETLEKIIMLFKDLSNECNSTLAQSNNQFELFQLFTNIRYKPDIDPRIGLSLFMYNRQVIKVVYNVLMRSNLNIVARYMRVIVLDHMVLICEEIKKENTSCLYISDNPLPLCEYICVDNTAQNDDDHIYFNRQFSFAMQHKSKIYCVYFYFNERSTCNELKVCIETATDKFLSHYDQRIKLKKISDFNITDVENIVICDNFYNGNTFDNIKDLEILENESLKELQDHKEQNTDENEDYQKMKAEKIKNIMKECGYIQNGKITYRFNYNIMKYFDFEDEKTCNNWNDCEDDLSKSILQSNYENSCVYNDQEISNLKNLKKKQFIEARMPLPLDTKEDIFDVSDLKTLLMAQRSSKSLYSLFADNSENDQNLVFFVSKWGIDMKSSKGVRRIYHKMVDLIYYIKRLDLLLFSNDDLLMYAMVDCKTEILFPINICNRVYKFFYGQTQETDYIIVILNNHLPTSFMALYEIKFENDITIDLKTKLYVGYETYNAILYQNKMLACCRQVEMIDIETLNGNPFQDPTDLTYGLFTKDFTYTKIMNIFKIRNDVFLICTDKDAYFVNEYGNVHENTIHLIWYSLPKDIRLFGNFIAILTAHGGFIYDVETGTMSMRIMHENLRFVLGCEYLWVHDGKSIYEITVPSVFGVEINQKTFSCNEK